MAVATENGSRKRTVARGSVSTPTVRGLAGLSGAALRLLKAAGFEVVAIDSVAVEGVVDGLAVRAEAPEEAPPVFFRFIQNRDLTRIAAVRDLRRVMTGRAAAGLLITAGSLTADARSEASRAGSAHIDVIDRQYLEELLAGTAGRRDQPTDVLETLTTETLRKRTLDIFPAGYLTVMAIIQGVALGLLLQQLLGAGGGGVFRSPHPGALISEAVASFLAIVVASYEYLWFTTIMRWTPTFLDTLVPYLLGVAEIVPVLLLGRFTWWWISTVVLFAVGGLAFWHTIWRSSPGMFEDPRPAAQAGRDSHPGYRVLLRLLRKLVGSCGAMTAGGIVIYVLMINFRVPGWTDTVLPWFVTLSASVIVLLSELSLRKFYRDYRLPWRLGGKDAHDVRPSRQLAGQRLRALARRS